MWYRPGNRGVGRKVEAFTHLSTYENEAFRVLGGFSE